MNRVYQFDADLRVNLSPEVADALERYNFESVKDPERYFENLGGRVGRYQPTENKQGVRYALISHNGDSREEAVLWQEQWATSIAPRLPMEIAALLSRDDNSEEKMQYIAQVGNTHDTNSLRSLVEADFMHYALSHVGIRADDGSPLPVLAVSAPSMDRSRIGVEASGAGPASKLAHSALQVAEYERFGRLHLGGTSLGSVIVQQALVHPFSRRFDIESVLLSEAPNTHKRSLPEFGKAYATDTKGLKLPEDDWKVQGPALWKQLDRHGKGFDSKNVWGNRNLLLNLFRLTKEMRKGTLPEALDYVIDEQIPTTIEFGTGSKISRGTRALLDSSNGVVARPSAAVGLQVIEARGISPHAHNLSIPYMGEIAVQSIRFAKDRAR